MKNSKRLWVAFLVVAFIGCVYPSLGLAADEAKIQKDFEAFCANWTKMLNAQGKFGQGSMQVKGGAGGGSLYVARYDEIKDRAGRDIERTNQPATPYIGVMRYEIWTCSAFGNTSEAARAGKFECELKDHIREIFRFDGSKWVY